MVYGRETGVPARTRNSYPSCMIVRKRLLVLTVFRLPLLQLHLLSCLCSAFTPHYRHHQHHRTSNPKLVMSSSTKRGRVSSLGTNSCSAAVKEDGAGYVNKPRKRSRSKKITVEDVPIEMAKRVAKHELGEIATEGDEVVVGSTIKSGSEIGDTLVSISRQLHDRLRDLKFRGTSKQPVTCSYNVLEYASNTHETYARRYGGRCTGRALLVGMNPGPWGMVQTGVPFGEVGFVRDWLGVEGAVGRPSKEHAKRPVEGFECRRSEVSGKRLWGFFERRFGCANKWGDKMFAYNYCPLTFMNASGGNITPDRLPAGERKTIEDACGDALADVVSALNPCVLIGVGNFAGAKCVEALEASGLGARVGAKKVHVVIVNHPSPASPTGIKWEKAMCMNELVLASSKCKEIDSFLV